MKNAEHRILRWLKEGNNARQRKEGRMENQRERREEIKKGRKERNKHAKIETWKKLTELLTSFLNKKLRSIAQ